LRCKVFIEALEIVHVVVVYQVQHGAEKGADDSHSNVMIVGLWAVILTRVNNALLFGRENSSAAPSQAEEPKHGHIPNLVLPPTTSAHYSPRLVNEDNMLPPHVINT